MKSPAVSPAAQAHMSACDPKTLLQPICQRSNCYTAQDLTKQVDTAAADDTPARASSQRFASQALCSLPSPIGGVIPQTFPVAHDCASRLFASTPLAGFPSAWAVGSVIPLTPVRCNPNTCPLEPVTVKCQGLHEHKQSVNPTALPRESLYFHLVGAGCGVLAAGGAAAAADAVQPDDDGHGALCHGRAQPAVHAQAARLQRAAHPGAHPRGLGRRRAPPAHCQPAVRVKP